MPLPREKIANARERLDLVADVYWGRHASMPSGHITEDPAAILEKVLIDYALVGKEPIDAIKKRAQQKVKELHETHG